MNIWWPSLYVTVNQGCHLKRSLEEDINIKMLLVCDILIEKYITHQHLLIHLIYKQNIGHPSPWLYIIICYIYLELYLVAGAITVTCKFGRDLMGRDYTTVILICSYDMHYAGGGPHRETWGVGKCCINCHCVCLALSCNSDVSCSCVCIYL